MGHKLYDITREVMPDTGCEVAPKCLECPLPQCKYDMGAAYLHYQTTQRALQAVGIINTEGLSIAEAAARFNTTKRQIFRYLAHNRREQGLAP